MTHRIATRVVPAIVLLSLLGTGTAQAFCFLKKNERRMDYGSSRMPAIGFSPTVFQDYPSYAPLPMTRYGNPAMPPQQPANDSRYDTGSVYRY